MIDYLTVCYKNYDLISLQIENFKSRFNRSDYRLIVVDNTPDKQKNKELNNQFRESGIVDLIIEIPSSDGMFDAVSHGGAIDEGLKYCNSDIICIFDSDFFILDNDINEYILDKFGEDYCGVGSPFNCSSIHQKWVNKSPKDFENIPMGYGSYFSSEIAKSNTWVLTNEECNIHKTIPSNTFIETGWRIRKHILDNNLKTMTWDTTHVDFENGEIQYIRNENDKLVGIHSWAGSHRDNTPSKNNKIREILKDIL